MQITTLSRIKALIIKEFLAVWRDKSSRVVLIVPPLIQLIIFSFAATLEVKDVPIAILNRDSGKASIELIQRFDGSRYFPKIYHLQNPEQVREYINSQKVPLVVQINDDFSQKVYAHQPAQIQLLLDGRKSNTTQILAGYVNGVVSQYAADMAAPAALQTFPSTVAARNWFNVNLDYTLYTVPGIIGILTTVMGLIITALSVAREREFGTFDQLLVSPLEPVEILIGKAVPAFIIGIFEASLIFTLGVLLFKVPFVGSIPLLYLSMSVYLLSIIGVGLFISSISKTQQQAILGTFIFMVPAIMLSGYATPIENMPDWLQNFTVINPLKYFLIIIKGVLLKDMPFDVVIGNIVPMIIIAAFTLSFSAFMFKQRLE